MKSKKNLLSALKVSVYLVFVFHFKPICDETQPYYPSHFYWMSGYITVSRKLIQKYEELEELHRKIHLDYPWNV